MPLWCPYLLVCAVYTYPEIIEPWCDYKRSICHEDIRTIYTRKNRTRTYKAQCIRDSLRLIFPWDMFTLNGIVWTPSYPLYLTFHFRDRRGAALLRFFCVNRSPIWYTLFFYKNRAIFVWPWNENAQTKQKQQTNENRAIWLVYRTDMNARGFWLVKRTLGWKNFMPENFLEINRYFALTSHCNTIGQSNNAFSILGCFFGGKTKRPCFDLFIHWLINK